MTINKTLDQLNEIGTIKNLYDRGDNPKFNGYYVDRDANSPAVYYYDKFNDELKLVPFIPGEKYFKVRLRDTNGKEYIIGYNFIIANVFYFGGKQILEHPENYMNFPLFSKDEKYNRLDFYQWQPIPKNFGVAYKYGYEKTEKYRDHIASIENINPDHPDIGFRLPVEVEVEAEESQPIQNQDKECVISWGTVPQEKKDWIKVAIRKGWIEKPAEFAKGLKHSKNLISLLERQVREENNGE